MIGLMALIITALLLICHWLCAVDSHSVIDTCSKPVLYPTSGCFTCVGECWWLPELPAWSSCFKWLLIFYFFMCANSVNLEEYLSAFVFISVNTVQVYSSGHLKV